MKTKQAVVRRCWKCQRVIIMGVNAIFDEDRPVCDRCGHVVRNRLGYAFTADEGVPGLKKQNSKRR